MAQPGNFTPILLYGSSTPTNVPLAANLTNSATGSEIAINVADKNLFFKDSGGVVNTVPIRQSSTSSNGWLSSTDWNTFNSKAPATSGTSILYGNGAGGFSNVTIGTGISFAGGTLSATGSGGTVTSVAALTLGTTGTDLSSTVANGTTTPVITLNVPTASAANRGALSAADWSTFNGKQAALVSGTNIKTVGGVTLLGSGDVGTIGVGYGGTGTSTAFTAGSVVFAGASGVYSQSNANFFWDNTNKRLGLNTTTPGYQLNTYASVDVLSIQQVAQVNTAGSGTAAIGFNVSFVAGEGSNTKGGIGFQRNAAYGGGFMAFYNNNSGAAGDFTTADEAMRIHNSKGVSIGNTTYPGVGNLRLSGFLENFTNGSTALANALNSDLVITTNSGFMTFTGGGASCQLGGMVAGLDGQRVVILNTTGSTITIIGESGSSTAANRIWTPGLASVGWNNLGSREFIYSGSQSRWLMIGASAS
jgi:hypothetical protein